MGPTLVNFHLFLFIPNSLTCFNSLVFGNVGNNCDVYPSVGLRHSDEAVRVNFGHEPFKYDVEYHVQQTWAKILSTPLDQTLLG